jgi:tetratricopeptide (TPR) repeat protein
MTIWATKATGIRGGIEPSPDDLLKRLLLASYGIMFCAVAVAVPVKLAPFYMRPIPFNHGDPLFVSALVAVLAVTVILVLLRRRAPWLLAAWIAHLLLILPASSLITHGGQLTADRYTYLSSVVWVTLIGAGMMRLWDIRRDTAGRAVCAVSALAVVILLGGMARSYCAAWRDSVSVWSAMVQRNPRFVMGYYNLAKAQRISGDHKAAMKNYRKAIEINPHHPEAHVDLGSMLKETGDVDAAVHHYESALRGRPGFYMAHFNLAYIMANQERYEEAVAHFEAARADAVRCGDDRIIAHIEHDLPRALDAAERSQYENLTP